LHSQNRYWSVNPELANRSSSDLYGTFLTEFLPDFEKNKSFDEPCLSRDIPPWLKVSRFHEYLGDYVTDDSKRQKLMEVSHQPRSTDALFGKLHQWVFNYLKEVCNIAKFKVPYTFLKYIMSLSEARQASSIFEFTQHSSDGILALIIMSRHSLCWMTPVVSKSTVFRWSRCLPILYVAMKSQIP
jgi:hypothetical protein